LSTEKRPKQFLSLVGKDTLLAQAVQRLEGLIPPERILVITGQEQWDAAHAAAPMLPPDHILGEPVGRDTAAAIALGAAWVAAKNPESVFVVLTADHIIGDIACFQNTLRDAFSLASSGSCLVTLGVRPTEPSAAYGYLEAGEAVPFPGGSTSFRQVKQFVEKPDKATAARYLEAGTYYWNAGMFIWRVATIRDAFAVYRPALAALMEALASALRDGRLQEAMEKLYPSLEKISIDYAVMEKADEVVVALCTFPWDDVGSWDALARHYAADSDGNVQIGQTLCINAEGNLALSTEGVTALIGVRDLIVVRSGGATLVCHRDCAQDVKKAVQALRLRGDCANVL